MSLLLLFRPRSRSGGGGLVSAGLGDVEKLKRRKSRQEKAARVAEKVLSKVKNPEKDKKAISTAVNLLEKAFLIDKGRELDQLQALIDRLFADFNDLLIKSQRERFLQALLELIKASEENQKQLEEEISIIFAIL